ncbi:sterol desaturase family protein [Phreatobacter sp.]|uniref:sterol desaturase family protein n=1 Tax=Phreatobacter sp. TaxID=1966341 RepID=UPI003F6F24EB
MPILAEIRALAADALAVMRHPDARGAVVIYSVLSLAFFIGALWTAGLVWTLVAAAIGIAILPVVEFVTHRYVLHLLELARTPPTAAFWNRAHYAHHMEPRDTRVILAHPASAVLLIAVVASIVWFIGLAPVAPLVAVGFALFAFYEIVHFACHMDGETRSAYFTRRRQEHALHHYVDENRNYGITTAIADRLFGTRIVDRKTLQRSPTVRNLGYTGEFADRYPYLKRDRDQPPGEPR